MCTVCNVDINISHGGRSDIVTHSKTKKHIVNYSVVSKSSKLQFASKPDDFMTIKAELLFTNFILEHNVPVVTADHFTKLMSAMYPNVEAVKKFSCGRTKTGHII